jgi:membrane-bound lytic murein transglycosylase A
MANGESRIITRIVHRAAATLLFAGSTALLAVVGCAAQPVSPSRTAASQAAAAPEPPPAAPPLNAANLASASFAELPGWPRDDHRAALAAFRAGCPILEKSDAWRAACARAREADSERNPRGFFETSFRVFRLLNSDGSDTGMITGYYEPLLHGSRTRSGSSIYPVYGPPDDLISVDVGPAYPETRDMRLRGRLVGHRLVPYYTRAEIDAGVAPLAGKEILWVDDRIALFFLHVQGSGRVQLDDGTIVRIGYADYNGYPYRSIGRALVDRGEVGAQQASMQAIRAWALLNPERVEDLLSVNPSYVFFRVLGTDTVRSDQGAPGSLGVPLSAGRSIAVDTRFIPLGAPVYLATTQPQSASPLERTVIAQDTGNAIRGAVRADYYWGSGEEADREAGRMRQTGRMWLMLPREYPLTQN